MRLNLITQGTLSTHRLTFAKIRLSCPLVYIISLPVLFDSLVTVVNAEAPPTDPPILFVPTKSGSPLLSVIPQILPYDLCAAQPDYHPIIFHTPIPPKFLRDLQYKTNVHHYQILARYTGNNICFQLSRHFRDSPKNSTKQSTSNSYIRHSQYRPCTTDPKHLQIL